MKKEKKHTRLEKYLIKQNSDIGDKKEYEPLNINRSSAFLRKIIAFNLGNTKEQLGQKLLKERKKENPNIYLIKELLACGADTNTRNDNGWTALMCASFKGNAGIVRMLLAAEADLSAIRTTDRSTALLGASYNGHTETV